MLVLKAFVYDDNLPFEVMESEFLDALVNVRILDIDDAYVDVKLSSITEMEGI